MPSASAGQAAPASSGPGVHAARQHQDRPGRRAGRARRTGTWRDGRRGAVPRGPLLPAQRRRARDPAAARSGARRSRCSSTLPAPLASARYGRRAPVAAGGELQRFCTTVAGQRARAREPGEADRRAGTEAWVPEELRLDSAGALPDGEGPAVADEPSAGQSLTEIRPAGGGGGRAARPHAGVPEEVNWNRTEAARRLKVNYKIDSRQDRGLPDRASPARVTGQLSGGELLGRPPQQRGRRPQIAGGGGVAGALAVIRIAASSPLPGWASAFSVFAYSRAAPSPGLIGRSEGAGARGS